MAMGMKLTDQHCQLGAVTGCFAAFVDRLDQAQALLLVSDMPRPLILGRQAFTDVMQQAGPAHVQRLVVLRALVQHPEHMHAGIDFRVVCLRLRHTE